MDQRKAHWENVYHSKKPDEVSWFQPTASKSLDLIASTKLSKDGNIIDVGGGASTLVDGLLELGFKNITVLDLSGAALKYAQERLGGNASAIKWIEEDITQFMPEEVFDLWHDRAVFHFLTNEEDRRKYVANVKRGLKQGGFLIVASFALDGPEKCSGLPVCRYDARAIQLEFGSEFELLQETKEVHKTPWESEQRFNYFLLKRLS